MADNKVLKARGSLYGDIGVVSMISQKMKDEFYLALSLETEPKYEEINAIIMECSEMIIHKLSRVASGNPYYLDNFRDISNYAQLVVNKLSKLEGAIDSDCQKMECVKNEDGLVYWKEKED